MSSFVFAFPLSTGVLRLGRMTISLAPQGASAADPVAAAPANAAEPAGKLEDEIQPTPSEFRPYTLHNDGAADISCEAKVVGQVVRPTVNFRGEILTVLETKAGTRIGVKTGVSLVPGERMRQTAQAFASEKELLEFFGYTPLAKLLYEKLNLAAAQVVA